MSGEGISLTLQRVMEAKMVKNRMHLDLLVDDVEAEVHRLELLGATRLTPTAHEEFGQIWCVLADPEGTSFASPTTRRPGHPLVSERRCPDWGSACGTVDAGLERLA